MSKSLKDCTDEEVIDAVKKAFLRIRETPNKYGIIKIEISGGKVKFITVETPLVSDQI